MSELNFKEEMRNLRAQIKETGAKVRSWEVAADTWTLKVPSGVDEREMAANLMLSYRHLEDAATRLGKAIQAFDGGKSVYDT